MLKQIVASPPELKSPRELALMREAGKLVAAALKIARSMCVVGTRTIDIDHALEAHYASHGAIPLFKGYPGKTPFPAVTCISINEQVVHGIPSARVLKAGDLVKLDTACKLNGWCADRAITVPVGTIRPEWQRLLKVGEEVLALAIRELSRCRRWTEVSSKMQKHAEVAGYSVVKQYVGHGIGRIMHESPQVPNYVDHEVRKSDFLLQEGLVLAVEPMVNLGRPDVETLGDHWTVVTRDRAPSVHVEHTLALTRDGVMIITSDEDPAPVVR